MKKKLFGLAAMAVFVAVAAIFTPHSTMDNAQLIANDLKRLGTEGSQAQLASYLQSGKVAAPAAVHSGPTTYGPGIGEQVFGGLADKP